MEPRDVIREVAELWALERYRRGRGLHRPRADRARFLRWRRLTLRAPAKAGLGPGWLLELLVLRLHPQWLEALVPHWRSVGPRAPESRAVSRIPRSTDLAGLVAWTVVTMLPELALYLRWQEAQTRLRWPAEPTAAASPGASDPPADAPPEAPSPEPPGPPPE